MGRVLLAAGPIPEAMLCSAAARAADTARALAEVVGLSSSGLKQDERLYLASAETLTQVAAETDDVISTLLVVAHNPGVEEWVAQLCGARARFPTAALAAIQLPMSRWLDSSRGRGQLLWLIGPRIIREIG